VGWFSKKQPKAADDVLVERTLAFAQEVAQEQPDDEQALLALIDGIKHMPPKPAAAVATDTAVADEAPLPGAPEPSALLPATLLPPISLAPVKMSVSSPEPILIAEPTAEEPLYPRASEPAVPMAVSSGFNTSDRSNTNGAGSDAARFNPARLDSSLPAAASPAPELSGSVLPVSRQPVSGLPVTLPVTIETPPAPPLPPPVLRPANAERPRQPEPRSSAPPPPKQSEMRREIAQRVQNFKAHQQRLNDEREARIKKIYADMQARLEKSGAPKSPPIS
jgi:hypothetical protein